MTWRALTATALLLIPAAAPGQTAPPVARFVVSGVTVIHKSITANDVVALRLYLKGGSAALTPATAGIEQLMSQTATHGSVKYSKDAFNSLATATGTEIGSQVAFDFTVLTAQAVRQHWNEAWDLFTQAALHPAFPTEEVEQVRNQLLDGLQQERDLPDPHLNHLADSLLYAGHPYAVDPEGTPEAVGRLTRDDLVQWHRRRMTKANLLLVVAGNIPRADLEAKVGAAFGSLPAAGGEAALAAPVAGTTRDMVVTPQQLPTNYVMGVYAAPNLASADYPAFRVATRVLGERLFEEVRTKRNLSYAVRAGIANRAANRGELYVTAVQPDTTLKVMLGEVRRLKDELAPANRLGQSVNVFLTAHLMSQQTNMGQAAELGLWEIVGGGWENAGGFLEKLRAVTPQDVQRVARTYLTNFRFAVIGDPAKIDRGLFTSL
ncbi:MAG: insulinase family protein [Gemmatimonadetes bacterium]|nr:insulinase family protein [Gemmatimonadota bacterium]